MVVTRSMTRLNRNRIILESLPNDKRRQHSMSKTNRKRANSFMNIECLILLSIMFLLYLPLVLIFTYSSMPESVKYYIKAFIAYSYTFREELIEFFRYAMLNMNIISITIFIIVFGIVI